MKQGTRAETLDYSHLHPLACSHTDTRKPSGTHFHTCAYTQMWHPHICAHTSHAHALTLARLSGTHSLLHTHINTGVVPTHLCTRTAHSHTDTRKALWHTLTSHQQEQECQCSGTGHATSMEQACGPVGGRTVPWLLDLSMGPGHRWDKLEGTGGWMVDVCDPLLDTPTTAAAGLLPGNRSTVVRGLSLGHLCVVECTCQ